MSLAVRMLPALLLAAAFAGAAQGDVFLLTSGGRVEGEWLNREEQPRRQYLVKTAAGVTLTLRLDQVSEALTQSEAELEYARRAPATADTAAAQWALAEWCRKQGLANQRRTHLERVIELEPDHSRARALLGFVFLQGQWTTREYFRRGEGYEYHNRKWRTPQEIEIREARAALDAAQRQWRRQLTHWRRDLNDPAKARGARSMLAAIRDPVAVVPLGEHFARERARPVKVLYADILAAINTAEAVGVLVERALDDPDEEIYHYCIDRLAERSPPYIADPFIKNLKHASNLRVNRAAAALGRLGDRTAVAPLIEALITTHAQVIPGPPGTGPDTTTSTFTDEGTFYKQAEGPKLLIAHVQNQAVLDALHRLSGVSFGFDQRAWRYWHAQEKLAREAGATPLDGRRQ